MYDKVEIFLCNNNNISKLIMKVVIYCDIDNKYNIYNVYGYE